MTKVPATLQSPILNADRIAAASKQIRPAAAESKAPSFQRERPFDTQNAEFVELDGKRYYLNAPRGTYLNILV